MRFCLVFLALLLLALPASAQFMPIPASQPQPEYYWTVIDGNELALWHNGVQIGNYVIDTETYYPRKAPGIWGVPEDPPVHLPTNYLANHPRSPKKSWRTHGVT